MHKIIQIQVMSLGLSSDFDHDVVVGTTQAGLRISETTPGILTNNG